MSNNDEFELRDEEVDPNLDSDEITVKYENLLTHTFESITCPIGTVWNDVIEENGGIGRSNVSEVVCNLNGGDIDYNEIIDREVEHQDILKISEHEPGA